MPVGGVGGSRFGIGPWACSQGDEIPNEIEEGPWLRLPRGHGQGSLILLEILEIGAEEDQGRDSGPLLQCFVAKVVSWLFLCFVVKESREKRLVSTLNSSLKGLSELRSNKWLERVNLDRSRMLWRICNLSCEERSSLDRVIAVKYFV